MKKQDWIYVIIAIVIVSVVVSIVSVKLASSDLSLSPAQRNGVTTYTKDDIDKMLSQVPTYNELSGNLSRISSLYSERCAIFSTVIEGTSKIINLTTNTGYYIGLSFVDANSVKFNIGGSATNSLKEGQSLLLNPTGAILKVKDIRYSSKITVPSQVDFTINEC